MKRLLLLPFLALAVVLAAACSSPSTSKPASAECGATSECASSLTCLTLATFSGDGGACTAGPQICSKTCAGDPDCAPLGPKYKCFAGCSGPGTCGSTP